MYVKLTDGVASEYSLADLFRDNPNTSFPDRIPDERLADYGMYPCAVDPQPVVDHTKNIERGTFEQRDGSWFLGWIVVDATTEEIAQRLASQWAAVRWERNRRLSDCDWTQLADATVDAAAWAVYRQALRDLPETQSDPFAIVWPTTP